MKPEHLNIEIIDRQPRGGQRVGVVPSGVKVTHIPTGLSATCEIERSQHRNKAVACSMIEWGLAEIGWTE